MKQIELGNIGHFALFCNNWGVMIVGILKFIDFIRMKKVTFYCHSLLLSVFICPFSTVLAKEAVNNNDWNIWKSTENSRISYRKLTHSPLIEIKAQTTIESTLSGFMYFMQDTQNIAQWLDNAINSEIVEIITPTTIVVKTEFDGFWLVNNREMLVKSHYWQNDNLSIEITVENANTSLKHEAPSITTTKEIKNNANTIMIDVISAHWLITPIENNNIVIEYQFIVDPKGSIPHWIANKLTLSSTWQTINNINHQVPSSPWQNKTLENIREFK